MPGGSALPALLPVPLRTLFSQQDAVLRAAMAVWARPLSRWRCLLNTARAVGFARGLRSRGCTARACPELGPLAELPAGNEGVLCRLQAYRHLSVRSCSPPDSAKDGSFPSPESNLPSVQQQQATAETLPDLSAEILDEGKRL